MYNHHIDDMVDAISNGFINKKVLRKTVRKVNKKVLRKTVRKVNKKVLRKTVRKALLINKKVLRKTVRKALQDYWDDKIAIVWNTEDVIEVAIKNGRLINEEQAKEVLGSVLDNHDANVGVNCDVLFQNLPQN